MRYHLIPTRNNWSPFSQFMKEFEDEFFSPLAPLTGTTTMASPRMEWQENEKAYLLSFDVPGMNEEDIKIDLKDNTLSVVAERKQAMERKEGETLRSEKFYGVYHRSIELPSDVDADGVQAEYSNGVLEILVPKTEKSQAKSIQIGKEGKLSERFLGSGAQKISGQSSAAEKTESKH